MTSAMLLCAGLSTRLGALSTQCPKPMLPMCGIPILRFGIANLVAHGIRDLVINLHHRGDVIEKHIGDGSALGANIQYSTEDEILGTGGGLKRALDLLDPEKKNQPFLSLNGKLIFDLDLKDVLAAFERNGDVLGMMVVRPVADAMDWGAVDVEEGEKPRVRNILGKGSFMFGGVHVTRRETIEKIPEGEACMVRQGYLPWIQAGGQVGAYIADPTRYFAEHSTPERYLQGNLDLLGGARLAHPPGELVGVSSDATIEEGAEIIEPVRIAAGAHIEAGAVIGPNAVIGARARVRAGTKLRNCVVWADSVANGAHEQSVITPNGVVAAE